jgi:hypothetical protein
MVEAVGRLAELDPSDCRRRAAAFGVEPMCARYERAYRALLERAASPVPRQSPAAAD